MRPLALASAGTPRLPEASGGAERHLTCAQSRDAAGPRDICYTNSMREGETELDMIKRHVQDGVRHIAKQRALIDRLRRRGLPTDQAEALLVNFELIQRQHQDHLSRIEARDDMSL